MDELAIALFSLGIGGLISAVASWYFFRKGIQKRLSIYIQLASPVLAGIDDPEVRAALEINYRGSKINDLLQLQLVIANEGQRAIRDLIEPLSVKLPKTARVLEAAILHVEPKGREVTVTTAESPDGSTQVGLEFKLLNRGEYFFVKLLINGDLDPDALRFHISVDDLPPTITPAWQPFGSRSDEPASGWQAILLGVVPLALGASTAYIIYLFSAIRPELFPGHLRFEWFSIATAALALTVASTAYWIVRGLRMTVGRGVFAPKQRFQLPRSSQISEFRGVMPSRFYGGQVDLTDPALGLFINDMPPEQRRLMRRQIVKARLEAELREREDD